MGIEHMNISTKRRVSTVTAYTFKLVRFVLQVYSYNVYTELNESVVCM